MYYDRLGGIERLMNVETMVAKGTFTTQDTLEKTGNLIMYQAGPVKFREEYEFDGRRDISGDNGVVGWSFDGNQLEVHNDDYLDSERQISKLLDQFDHLNRNSKYFKLQSKGIETKADSAWFVVGLTNIVNDNFKWFFIDTSTFLLHVLVWSTPDQFFRVVYSDYRDIDGILTPFESQILAQPSNWTYKIVYNEVVYNAAINDSLFDPPTKP